MPNSNTVTPASAHTLTVSTCLSRNNTKSVHVLACKRKSPVSVCVCLFCFLSLYFGLISISPPLFIFYFYFIFWLACEQRRFHHSCGNRRNNTPGNASIIRNIHIVMHCAHASLSFCHFGCVTALLLSAFC